MRTIVLVLWSMACVPRSPTAAAPVEGATPEPVASAGFAEAWRAFDAARPASFWEPMNEEAVRGVEDEGLRRLLHEHWEWTMQRSPTWATGLGDHRFDAELSDGSEDAVAAWRAAREGWLQQAEAIEGLEGADVLTRELLVAELQTGLATDVCRFRHWSLLPRSSPLVTINSLPEELQVASVEDGQNLLSRYRGASRLLQDEIEALRVGLADGLVANAHSVGLVIEMLDRQLAEPVEDWPLWLPLETDHPDWDPQLDAAWRAELDAVVRAEIGPALATYRDFLQTEVLPVARPADQTGLSSLPLGADCYTALIRKYTTLDRDAAVIHQQGLDALEGIHDEFRALGEGLWGTRDLAAIFERLRTDEALHFTESSEVQAKAEAALASAMEVMPEFFGRLPQAECVVEPIPEFEAPYTTVAYYRPSTPGERPGTYFINTYAPETRPRHEAEVLAYHESIPGHHLQIAISQELPAVPAFRRHGGFTVFVEGWALYTERLADEMGLYTGDVDRLGMLSFDAWRASRLVVDTGVHHLGWSREQAVDFLIENTPLATNNVDNEVDRYITWPGQALAYKTGQIEIWRMRREAEAALGPAFDVRAFHDVVLGAGSVPLATLEARVDAWVDGHRE